MRHNETKARTGWGRARGPRVGERKERLLLLSYLQKNKGKGKGGKRGGEKKAITRGTPAKPCEGGV